MKINWKQKLSSRKFWSLCIALIVSILTAVGASPGTTEYIVGIITAVSSCAIYMLAESLADSGRGE